MFEPITLALIGQSLVTSQVIGSIIGGIIGNRADSFLCDSIRIIYRRFVQQPANLDNHDIQRAVREAYLKAALMVCENYQRNNYNITDRLFDSTAWDLKRVIKYLHRELVNIHKAEFILPTNQAEAEHIALLQPLNVAAKRRLDDLRTLLKEELIRELEGADLDVGAGLKLYIREGWFEDGQFLDWFELMMAFFAEIQKTNERVRTLIQNEILLNIQQHITGLDNITEAFDKILTDFRAAVETFLPSIEEFMARIDRLNALYLHCARIG